MAFSSGGYEMALPVELTDEICSYLDAEDVLSLSATNTFWRNAVNRDYIWKRLCLRYFNVNASEKPLIERKCRVEPPFETVTNSCQNLSDICVWRIRFAQEIYVLNNWKLKRFQTEDFPKNRIKYLSPERYLVFGNFVVYYCFCRDEILIWKLTDDGFIQMESIDFSEGTLRPIGNGFVVYSRTFISYYVFNEDSFQLKIRTLISKALHPDAPLLADPSYLKEYEENRFRNVNEDYLYQSSNDRYYVFLRKNDESTTFIIWDFLNLKTFSSFFNNGHKQYPMFFLAEGESSILYLHFSPVYNSGTVTYSTNSTFQIQNSVYNSGTVTYIFQIQNSNIIILDIYESMDTSLVQRISDDSVECNQEAIVFIHKDATRLLCFYYKPNVIYFTTSQIVMSYSFFFLALRTLHPENVILIDRRTGTVRIIGQYKSIWDVKNYFKWGSPYFGVSLPELKEENLKNLYKRDCSETLLIDLSKFLKIYDNGFDCIANNNKIVITPQKKVLYFW